MANPNKVWGQTKIRVDGSELLTEGKSSLEMGGIKRTSVQADHAAGFFNETVEPSKIECSVLMRPDLSLSRLGAIDDATIQFETDTGQLYLIRRAYCAEPPSASDGKVKLTFQGPPAEEVTL